MSYESCRPITNHTRNLNTRDECSDTSRERSRVSKRVDLVKGYGTIDSIGVPSVGSNVVDTEQVEFKINIYKCNESYEGEIYLVNYDKRRKYNSNKLLFFKGDENSCLCIFEMTSDDGCCHYQMVVEASPLVCIRGSGPMLFAYASPLNTTGINIGGEVIRGEIIFSGVSACGCHH